MGRPNLVHRITMTSEVTANNLLQIDIQLSQYFFRYLYCVCTICMCIYKVQSDNLHLISGLFLTLTAWSVLKGNQGMFGKFVL